MNGLLSPDRLSALDHATLYRMRGQTADRALQDLLASYEHRAFAREAVGENPLMSVPIALAAPLYQAAKMVPGLMSSRSRPSWDQMRHGLLGVREGLLGYLEK